MRSLLTAALTTMIPLAPALAAPPAHPVVAVQERWLKAYGDADEATMRPILRDDATIGESSGQIASKADILKRAQMPALGLRLATSERTVRNLGRVALVTVLVTETRGTARTEFRVSETYVRDGARWRLAASQWTRLLDKPTAITADPAVMARVAGQYRTAGGTLVRVVPNGDGLDMLVDGAVPARFVSIGPMQFALPTGRVRWQFVSDSSGAVDQAVIHNGTALSLVRRVAP